MHAHKLMRMYAWKYSITIYCSAHVLFVAKCFYVQASTFFLHLFCKLINFIFLGMSGSFLCIFYTNQSSFSVSFQ